MDDFIIVNNSAEYLKQMITIVQSYLRDNLGLTLHKKKIYLQPCQKGVKFLGCFIKPSHIVVNHLTINNFKDRLYQYNKIAEDHKPSKYEVLNYVSSVNSYLGIMKHYKTYRKRYFILSKFVSQKRLNHVKVSQYKFYKVNVK